VNEFSMHSPTIPQQRRSGPARTIRFFAVIAAATMTLGVVPAQADPGDAIEIPSWSSYIGTDTNWFNPANWSTGRVPGERTSVLLDGNDDVVIDPALDPAPTAGGGKMHMEDISISQSARLTTLPGTVIETRNELIRDHGQIIHQSSESSGDGVLLLLADGPEPGLSLNPTPQAKRTVLLQGSVAFGLAGREPASPGHVGRGHYATMTARSVVLAGPLQVELLHGFTPVEGDAFQIVTATGAMLGQFDGLPEGALVARIDDEHGLFISYGRPIGPTGVTITLRQLSGG